MHALLPILTTLILLTSCNGNSPNTPQSSGTQSSVTPDPPPDVPASTNPSLTPLNSSARLMVDGQAVQLADAVPRITSGGAIAISNAANGLADKSYSASVTLRNQKSGAALTPSFKVEDVDRVEMNIEQVIVGRSSGNRWTGVFDTPNPAIKLTSAAGRLRGTVEVSLAPIESNEATMKKTIRARYEFENAIQ